MATRGPTTTLRTTGTTAGLPTGPTATPVAAKSTAGVTGATSSAGSASSTSSSSFAVPSIVTRLPVAPGAGGAGTTGGTPTTPTEPSLPTAHTQPSVPLTPWGTPIPEMKESVKVTSRKFYPQDSKENYLLYYLELLRSGDKNMQQELVAKIARQLTNEQFKQDMGMRNKKCPCGKKDSAQPCKLIDHNDIVRLICKYCLPEEKDKEWSTGLCRSCGIELTMWDERRPTQRLSCFNICAYDLNTCMTKEKMDNLRIYCRGCCVFAELCYYDRLTMDYYRSIVFHSRGDQSPGYYFPSIDIIDEQHRSVAIAANKNAGDRATISKQWKAQEGFVAYKLPETLERELLKDSERKAKIKAANNRNIDAFTSAYYGENDVDIKKIKSVKPVGEFKVESKTLSGKRKQPESKSAKAKAEAKAKAVAEAATPAKLLSDDDKFVVFKIPIDPRKSVKKKSLSALALTPIDRNQAIDPDNCLFTTRLLADLEKRFDYEEFLRWGLDCFRVVTPLFIPQKASIHTEQKWTKEDEEKVKEIGAITVTVKQKAEEIKSKNLEIKKLEAKKNDYVKDLRSKIISLVDSNENLDLLSKHNLAPSLSERKQMRTNLKPELMLNRLPELLANYGLLATNLDKDTVSEKCKLIVDNLFESAKPPPKKSTFSLKYYNPEEEKQKKAEKKKFVARKT